VQGKFYQAQALGQQAGFSEISGKRGEIFIIKNQNGKEIENPEIKSLAINKEKWILSAETSKIEDKEIFSQEVSKIILVPKDAVLSEISSKENYVVLKKDLPAAELKSLRELDWQGLNLEDSFSRYYPQEKFASNVIGFLGGDNIGQYGVEGFYEDILKGKKGVIEQKKGVDLSAEENQDKSLNGADIYLTLDYNIQFQAETLLKEAKKNLDIDSGQIIVLKPDSGRVVAMANYPSFDLNKYSKERNLEIFQNGVVQKIFEPGSVMKPFTMAIALNEGKVTPETTYTDYGFVKVGIETIHNFDKKIYGEQTMTGVLEKSINTGAVFVSKLVAPDVYLNYLDKFGFNEKTGIDLQGEVYSINKSLKSGREVNIATSSFGQGIEMTPMRLASSFCAFANGGKLVGPYIVEKIKDMQTEKNISRQPTDQVISQHTALQITNMLISVVDNGYSKAAKVPGYYVAGKTGTAQVPIENSAGYYEDRTIQSFIGYAPALNPQFLILIKLDNPKVSASSLSTPPIFGKLAKYILNYWQIPPDY
jgi:cell division protein FtsI/penicillin-binding protein 2